MATGGPKWGRVGGSSVTEGGTGLAGLLGVSVLVEAPSTVFWELRPGLPQLCDEETPG